MLKKKKTFPLAEIGDGDNWFYLKMCSKCSLLALFVWIHQDVFNILSNKGVTLGQDFCRIQILGKFLAVLAVWWKCWPCVSCWKSMRCSKQPALLLQHPQQEPCACSLPGEGTSAVSGVKHLPGLTHLWFLLQYPRSLCSVSGTCRALLTTQWTGCTSLASAPVLACHSQSGVTWCLK